MPNDVTPQYPWKEGDHLFASALNAAIADGPYQPSSTANVLYFGADPSGVADSTAAFSSAIAIGKSIYAPRGSYLIRNQLTLNNGQELFGDGRGLTTLRIDQTFSTSATGVISLTGREQLSPTVRDLTILFAQPSDQASRANFRTLAAGGTSGTGGTGVMYPPAIIITTSNRFKLRNLEIGGAWDGIAIAVGNNIGGFYIRDIEMGALNCGLSIDQCFDFGHISGYHFWNFGFSNTNYTGIYSDGNTFAAKFGVNGPSGANVTDFNVFRARVSIADANSTFLFANLAMDGNSTLEIATCLWIQIDGVYFTGQPSGANTSAGQLTVGGGVVIVNNLYSQAPSTAAASVINVTGGTLLLTGGQILSNGSAQSCIAASGGFINVRGMAIYPNRSFGPWTAPLIHISGAATVCAIQDNTITATPIGGSSPALVIDTDNAQHIVSGNQWDTWGWTPPGNLGAYGLNSDGYVGMALRARLVNVGLPTGASTGMYVQAAAGAQKEVGFYTGTTARWKFIVPNTAESGGNVGSDLAVQRFDDSGTLIGGTVPLLITRATGDTNIPMLRCVTFGMNIATGVGRQTVTGAKGGNAALASLLTALANFGIITDSTSA